MTLEQYPTDKVTYAFTLDEEEAALVKYLVRFASGAGGLVDYRNGGTREPSKQAVEIAKELNGKFDRVESNDNLYGNLSHVIENLPTYNVTIKVSGPRPKNNGDIPLAAEYSGRITDIRSVDDKFVVTLSNVIVINNVQDWNLFELYSSYSTRVYAESNEDV